MLAGGDSDPRFSSLSVDARPQSINKLSFVQKSNESISRWGRCCSLRAVLGVIPGFSKIISGVMCLISFVAENNWLIYQHLIFVIRRASGALQETHSIIESHRHNNVISSQSLTSH